MTSRYRVEYALKTHKRDEFIEWMKGLLAVPFVLHAESNMYILGDLTSSAHTEETRRRYSEIFNDVSKMIDEAVVCQNANAPKRSLLKQLVPSVGMFFTSLPLELAFQAHDQRYAISSRRLVSPSFNDIRLILNTAQIMSLAWGEKKLRLITFDGDLTLYDDGQSLTEDSPIIPRIIDILRRGIYVGIVTAAGYHEKSGERYNERLGELLKGIYRSFVLSDSQKMNLLIMGGESNYLYRYNGIKGELEWIEPEEWLLPEMKLWKEKDINELLNIAEMVLQSCKTSLKLPAQVIRKEKAVGLNPVFGKTLRREQLEETVLAAQKRLEVSPYSDKIGFCAFNGGSDVWVDIGDKRYGVKCLQNYLKGIKENETLHIGDQFASLGANDFKARMAACTAWIAKPEETAEILDELSEYLDQPKYLNIKYSNIQE